jgi:omega-amidase
MKLALIQMKGADSNEKNLNLALAKIDEAAANGADLAVLPEMFSCPYKASNFPLYAQPDGGSNWQKLSASAEKTESISLQAACPNLKLTIPALKA